MKAKEIMRKDVITVERWLTLHELAALFESRCISGAPVVDERGSVLGVVSQTDLVRSRRESGSAVPLYHRETDDSARSAGMHLEEVDDTRVEQIMTPGAISVDEETSVRELAARMIERHIHRVLVTREGRLTGIVTSMDMLKALARSRRK